MDYHQLESLRKGHPAWRLLAADHAVRRNRADASAAHFARATAN